MSFCNCNPFKSKKRVVITGIGALTPIGLNANESFENACNGKSGITRISQFDSSNFNVKIAGEVKGFDIDKYVNRKEQKKMDRFIHFSLACTQMALEDAGLKIKDEKIADKTAVILGVGIGGLPVIEKQRDILLNKGPSRVTPFFIPMVISNLAPGQISLLTGAKGANFTITSACASGAHAIGESYRYIKEGIYDAVICGGTEAVVTPLAIAGFASMKALSTRNDSPITASRPWDKDRDGFVLSEGSAILILEEYEHAKSRNAPIYAELKGYGMTSDAYHITSPEVEGQGAQKAMQMALNDAQLNKSDIQYINAHGTSTPNGDSIETYAIKKIFKEDVKNLWVSSTKSVMGHALGAAGAIESVFSILTIKNQIAPPTINLENPSDDCDLDYIPNNSREGKIINVMNNSFGFGGTNASLIFSKLN